MTPVTIGCDHSFCYSCLLQYLDDNNSCPICHSLVNLSTLKPNLELQEEVENSKPRPIYIPDKVKGIVRVLELNCSTEVYLTSRSIGSEAAIAIADRLKSNTSVRYLFLGDNSIGPEGAIAISNALRYNSSITSIYLGANSIGDVGVIAIAEALKVNSSVQRINLGDNAIISDRGALALASALKVNSSVITIYLGGNCLSSDAIGVLKEAVRKNGKHRDVQLIL
ncbi:hypothetical protein GEMRC1_000018 [Eukaryota sp. GEM-RC1]